MIIIAPSLLSSDYGKLGLEIERMEQSGAAWIHFDVMDGHFVPNLTIGVPVVKALKPYMKGKADIHLMITDPIDYVKPFAEAGADVISFHLESDSDPAETIRAIHEAGARASIALKPGTPAESVLPYLPDLDMVLVMTVEPGFGGQSFMADMLPKCRLIRDEAKKLGKDIDIQVDGGINENNIVEAARAGANVFVSGNTIFKAASASGMIRLMLDRANDAYTD